MVVKFELFVEGNERYVSTMNIAIMEAIKDSDHVLTGLTALAAPVLDATAALDVPLPLVEVVEVLEPDTVVDPELDPEAETAPAVVLLVPDEPVVPDEVPEPLDVALVPLVDAVEPDAALELDDEALGVVEEPSALDIAPVFELLGGVEAEAG